MKMHKRRRKGESKPDFHHGMAVKYLPANRKTPPRIPSGSVGVVCGEPVDIMNFYDMWDEAVGATRARKVCFHMVHVRFYIAPEPALVATIDLQPVDITP